MRPVGSDRQVGAGDVWIGVCERGSAKLGAVAEDLESGWKYQGLGHGTGEITLNKEDKEATKPAITLIVRDGSGAIVYGYTTYQMSELSVGVPTPFEITAFGVPDTAATFEVSATPWM